METLWQHKNKNSLNTCKRVVKSHELSLYTLDEMKTNLQDQNVMEIQGMQIKRKTGETIDTNTYIMTFNIHKIPKEIKIGCQKINVEPYIPNPLRYYKCQRFGHHQDQCTWLLVCKRCGKYDIHNDYQKDYKCANCQGNHGAGSRDCKLWKKEKEIAKLKHTQNISYPEIRRMVETTKYVEVRKKICHQPKNKVQPQNPRLLPSL